MAIMVPTASQNTLLNMMLGYTTPGNQRYKLFTNSITPALADVAATYTEMGAVQGYTYKDVVKASWTVATDTGNAKGTQTNLTWTFDGTGGTVNVYGYFVVDVTSGLLLWSEAFSSLKTVQYNGDQIIITPTFLLTKQ